MLQPTAERIECEPSYEPDVLDDEYSYRSHETCAECDEPTEIVRMCVVCQATICPDCACAVESDPRAYACPGCEGACIHVFVREGV